MESTPKTGNNHAITAAWRVDSAVDSLDSGVHLGVQWIPDGGVQRQDLQTLPLHTPSTLMQSVGRARPSQKFDCLMSEVAGEFAGRHGVTQPG